MKGFLDYLEELKDLRRPCTIRFRNVEGAVATIKAHIVGMDSVSGRDMLETDAGLVIGVDQLLDVNGHVPENYC